MIIAQREKVEDIISLEKTGKQKCQTCYVPEGENTIFLSCYINEKQEQQPSIPLQTKYKPSFRYMDTSSKFLCLMTTRDSNVSAVTHEYINKGLTSSFEQDHSASNPLSIVLSSLQKSLRFLVPCSS